MIKRLDKNILKNGKAYFLMLQIVMTGLLCVSLSNGAGSGNGDKIRAFPGAEGFGAYTRGGRGGKVYLVTTLKDYIPGEEKPIHGSLRAAVEAKGARIVIFRVSGNIELKQSLEISKPYITIAGQTAPGGGICLKNYELIVKTGEVIIRYMRLRPSDNKGKTIDSLSVLDGQNIIVDHCSMSWSVDETVSVTSHHQLDNVTIQWCIISESLNCSVHPKGCHGMGSLIRGSWGSKYSFHHNLYAHHQSRSPRPGNYNDHNIDPNGLILDFRNNVIYNWGGFYAGYNTDTNSITKMNFVGNHYKRGHNSEGNFAFRESCTYNRAYFSGNYMNKAYPDDPWSLVCYQNFSKAEKDAYKQAKPILVVPVETDDAITAYKRVLADAGATLPARDAVDARIINDVINGTGRIINDEEEVGGWPVIESSTAPTDTDRDGMPDDWEKKYGLNANNTSDNSRDTDSDGYTNVEEYINNTNPTRMEKG